MGFVVKVVAESEDTPGALLIQRDQARSIAVRLEQENAALVEALRAVTHPWRKRLIGGIAWCAEKGCFDLWADPVHRTPEVIAADLDAAAEVRDSLLPDPTRGGTA